MVFALARYVHPSLVVGVVVVGHELVKNPCVFSMHGIQENNTPCQAAKQLASQPAGEMTGLTKLTKPAD